MNVPAHVDIMESVLLKGDLSRLTPDERLRYYNESCKSLGLNPLTQPFSYVKLSGREVLYVTRNGADQLRKINGVSLEIVSEKIADNILTIHCRARLPDGRTDEDYGAVYFPDNLTGEPRANAKLKCVTKSKRRTTLSICGLGWLTEEEIEDIPVVAHRRPPPPAPNAMTVSQDKTMQINHETGEVGFTDRFVEAAIRKGMQTGEVVPPPAPNNAAAEQAATPDGPPPDVAALSLEDMAREAAMRGEAVFRKFYKSRSEEERKTLNAMGDELRGLMP